MPKIIKQLTATQINSLKPKAKTYDVADGKNLFLTITPNGTKSFYFRYNRPHIGTRTKITIGRYPQITLEKARKERERLTALILEGKDPQQAKAEEALNLRLKAKNTFKHAAEDWYTLHQTQVKPRTASKNWRTVELYLMPYLADMQVQNIAPAYVIDFLKHTLRQISKQGHKGVAIKKACTLLNQILDYAQNCGMIEFNKCQNIYKAFPAIKVEHIATVSATELPELLGTVNQASNIDESVKCLMKWQILTMVRPSEARLAKWTEIDFDRKIWEIPAERMKMGKPHAVPLSDQALAILERIAPFSQNRPYIFASPKKTFSPLSDKSVAGALQRIGYAGRQKPHGFRSLASTFLNESLLFSPDVIEAGLAHETAGEIRRIYNRSNYLEERKKMMQYWGDFCEECGILNGEHLKTV